MKKKITLLAVTFFLLSTAAIGATKLKFSEISDGWLSDTLYTNESLGIKFQTPTGWAANTDGATPEGLDYPASKEPTRKCIKTLVSYSMASSIHPDYRSIGSLFVLDPACFPDTKFPKVVDQNEVRKFAGKIIHTFSKSPYIGPNGADVGCFQKENLIFVILTGENIAHLSAGSPHENTLFVFTEFNGYWIGWGARADDERTEQLKSMTDNIKFWIGPKGKMP